MPKWATHSNVLLRCSLPLASVLRTEGNKAHPQSGFPRSNNYSGSSTGLMWRVWNCQDLGPHSKSLLQASQLKWWSVHPQVFPALIFSDTIFLEGRKSDALVPVQSRQEGDCSEVLTQLSSNKWGVCLFSRKMKRVTWKEATVLA